MEEEFHRGRIIDLTYCCIEPCLEWTEEHHREISMAEKEMNDFNRDEIN